MNRRTFLASLPLLASIPIARQISSNISVNWTPDQYPSVRFSGRLYFGWRDLMGIEIAWRKANGQWGRTDPANTRRPMLLRLGHFEDDSLCEWGNMPHRHKEFCIAFRNSTGRLLGDIPDDWLGQWRLGIRRMHPADLQCVRVDIVDAEHHCELM
jgi:hypothetical protein